MKMVLNSEMNELDKKTVEEYEIPGIILMENAALAVVEELNKFQFKKVVVVCGRGNNGGDGFVIARHLFNMGKDVEVFIVGRAKNLAENAELNYKILKNLKVKITEIENEGFLKYLESGLQQSDITVDALFGTGIHNNLRELAIKIIEKMNKLSETIISVDIPSGVCGDNGKILGDAVRADITVALGLPKCGNIMFPGSEYNGELIIKEIGIPKRLIEEQELKMHVIETHLDNLRIPLRTRNSHKGTYGKAGVIAGSTGMSGAAILTCKGALRSGVGLLKLYVPESLNTVIKTTVPEVITIPLNEVRKGVIGLTHIPTIIEQTEKLNVVAIGPGCGNTAELSETIRRMIESVEIPMVIDADGLNALSKNVAWLGQKKGEVILTPHIGEMAQLINKPIEEIIDNPIETARDFALEWKVYVVLKSSRTVVATPEGEVYVNLNGNPGMATAGSGDVLTGIITGLIAQGLDVLSAAVTGVYLHGMAGDIMAEKKGEYGLIAGDIVEGLTYSLNRVKELKYDNQKKGRGI